MKLIIIATLLLTAACTTNTVGNTQKNRSNFRQEKN